MSSNDPWLNPFLDPVKNCRSLTFNIISIEKRFLSKTILDNSFRLSYIDNSDGYLRIYKTTLIDNLMTIVVENKPISSCKIQEVSLTKTCFINCEVPD